MRASPFMVAAAAAGLVLASAALPSDPAQSDPAQSDPAQSDPAQSDPAPATKDRFASASPADGVPQLLFGILPPGPGDALFAVLPPPPEKVVLDPGYFGAVTVDHRAHLARRISCKLCHGKGPVHKIGRMTPAQAHESCRGCHEQLAKGPTDCRGCHVQKAPIETTIAEAPVAPEILARTRPLPLPGESAPPDDTASDPFSSIRTSVHAGTSMLAAPRVSGPVPGLVVGVSLRGDGLIASHTLEWAGPSAGHGRAIGLIGAGFLVPMCRRCDATLELIGGFDAREASFADLVPALGARAGFDLVGGPRWADSVRLSVTALSDLSQPHALTAQQAGGFTVSAALSVGIDVAKLR